MIVQELSQLPLSGHRGGVDPLAGGDVDDEGELGLIAIRGVGQAGEPGHLVEGPGLGPHLARPGRCPASRRPGCRSRRPRRGRRAAPVAVSLVLEQGSRTRSQVTALSETRPDPSATLRPAQVEAGLGEDGGAPRPVPPRTCRHPRLRTPSSLSSSSAVLLSDSASISADDLATAAATGGWRRPVRRRVPARNGAGPPIGARPAPRRSAVEHLGGVGGGVVRRPPKTPSPCRGEPAKPSLTDEGRERADLTLGMKRDGQARVVAHGVVAGLVADDGALDRR